MLEPCRLLGEDRRAWQDCGLNFSVLSTCLSSLLPSLSFRQDTQGPQTQWQSHCGAIGYLVLVPVLLLCGLFPAVVPLDFGEHCLPLSLRSPLLQDALMVPALT